MKQGRSYGLRAALVTATILFAVAGVAFTLISDGRVAGSVVARPMNWLAPLIAISVVLGVSGILLAQRGNRDEGNTTFDRTKCPTCEREVMGQWRMCPYCGSMLEPSTA